MCLSRFSKQRHPISPEKVRELVEYLFSETSKNNSSLMICNSLRTLTQQETKQVGHHWCPWKTVFPACDSYSFFHHFISVCACSKPALRRPFILVENIWERDSLFMDCDNPQCPVPIESRDTTCTCPVPINPPFTTLCPRRNLHIYAAEEAAGRLRAHGLGSCEQCCLNQLFICANKAIVDGQFQKSSTI